MCLLSVKEEPDYSVPARVRSVRKSRTYSPPRPSSARYSRTRIVEERKPSGPPLPPPAPSTYPDYPEPPAPPSPPSGNYNPDRVESRRSRNVAYSPNIQVQQSRSHYVEVEHDTSSNSSSSSSSNDDLRSRTTRKTSNTRKTGTIRPSSKPKTTAPPSEYSIHEREVRRERRVSKPREDYQTSGYVNAPPPDYRGSSSRFDERRASRGSGYRPSRETVVIEDDFSKRRREYRQ